MSPVVDDGAADVDDDALFEFELLLHDAATSITARATHTPASFEVFGVRGIV
jgi:hypothetical protein